MHWGAILQMTVTAKPPSDDKLTRSAEVMAGLFAGVFERESVAVDDDFFELGGDSLAGAALMAAVEKHFGCVLSMTKLLEAPTPRELAQAVLALNASRVVPWVVPVRASRQPSLSSTAPTANPCHRRGCRQASPAAPCMPSGR